MELKQIKELMSAMERTGTKKLFLKEDGFELQLERAVQEYQEQFTEGEGLYEEISPTLTKVRKGNAPLPKSSNMSQAIHGTEEVQKEVPGSFITSPMVGTFYSSPSPEDPAFIKVGDQIEKNSVVCIIEAMKVMNEIKSGISGTVAEILVENGHPVEFGTKLFRIT